MLDYERLIYICLIFALLVLSISFIVVSSVYKTKLQKLSSSLSVLKEQQKYHFNEDMEFLLYIIEYCTTIHINLILKPLSSLKDNKLLTDEDLNNAVEDIINDLNHYISEDYFKVIYKYFSKERFNEYLIKFVYNIIVVHISKDNASKIRSMNRVKGLDEVENSKKDSILFGRKADIDSE